MASPSIAAVALLLAACASPPASPPSVTPAVPAAPTTTEGGVPIDASRSARGQDSRVMFLVLHYTVADFPLSMKILTEQDVSAHYLLSDETPPKVYRLVDENRRAWHSGVSGWKGNRLLNASSIGIEIVHPGFKPGPDGKRVYQPFPQAQIDALVPLVQDIVARHAIRPERVLGHGEVTPAYKEDPGPTFPWAQLAARGVVPPLPDAARVAARRAEYEQPGALPDALWFQKTLAQHGYVVEPTGQFDRQTQRVLMNFQMRYRPADYSGTADAESAAILWVLTTPLPAAGAPAGPTMPAIPFPPTPTAPPAPATSSPAP